jgi:hypothetical protein
MKSGLRTVDYNFCSTIKMKRQVRYVKRYNKKPTRPGEYLVIDIYDFTPNKDGYRYLILVTDYTLGYY